MDFCAGVVIFTGYHQGEEIVGCCSAAKFFTSCAVAKKLFAPPPPQQKFLLAGRPTVISFVCAATVAAMKFFAPRLPLNFFLAPRHERALTTSIVQAIFLI